MYEFALTPRVKDHSWQKNWRPIDLVSGKEMEKKNIGEGGFIFEYFQVDILLVVQGVDFSLSGPGIPVLDFGLMMDFAARELKQSGLVEAETSISQDVLGFHERNGRVEMTASYTSGTAYTSVDEVSRLAREVLDKAIRLLFDAHSELRENTYIKSLLKKVGMVSG